MTRGLFVAFSIEAIVAIALASSGGRKQNGEFLFLHKEWKIKTG